MSDGLSDVRQMDRLGAELETAAHKLRKAIDEAKDGYRGLVVGNIEELVNDALWGSGYKLVKRG